MGFAKFVSRNAKLSASMDAKTIKFIERHSELDIAVGHLVRLWQEVEQGEEYGQTGIALEHKAGRFDGTLHLLKDWTVKEII